MDMPFEPPDAFRFIPYAEKTRRELLELYPPATRWERIRDALRSAFDWTADLFIDWASGNWRRERW